MLRKNLILILSFIFLFLSFGSVKAECPLNLNNLSIANQTNEDKADIIRLQSILYINDLYDGPITGYYGKLTTAAINNLKKQYNLNQDGIVDKDIINIICSNYTLCPFKSNLENPSEYPKKEIKFVQYFLRSIPNIYPEKLVTGYYGPKTENAVKNLQNYLNINSSGKIDSFTRQEFCKFFYSFDSGLINQEASSNTTSIFQTLCLAFPQATNTGEPVLFISQILGGNPPYKYIWNNENKYTDKTFKISFNTPGTHNINLKVVDSSGNISNSNCNVNIGGEVLGKDTLEQKNTEIDYNQNQQLTGNNLSVELGDNNQDTTKFDKYLYNKRYWTSGWICYNSKCSKIIKDKDIYNKLLYNILNVAYFSELNQYTMIYDTESECNNHCTSLGDKNKLALENKNITPISIPDTTEITNNLNIEPLVKNPASLNLEILPKEIIRGDPVKISVKNIPKNIAGLLGSYDNQIRGYWSGDIISQYLDLYLDLNALDSSYKLSVKKTNIKHIEFNNLQFAIKNSNNIKDKNSHFLLSQNLNNVSALKSKDITNSLNIEFLSKYSSKFENRGLGETTIYWTFDKSGSYDIAYDIYFFNQKENKEYLIASTGNNKIKVTRKPTAENYMKVFLTYQNPKSKIDACPERFYWVDPKTNETIKITKDDAKFKNSTTIYSNLPYRDLDGNFIAFDWDHMYNIENQLIREHRSYYAHSNLFSQPHTGWLSVPLLSTSKNQDISFTNDIDQYGLTKPDSWCSNYYHPFLNLNEKAYNVLFNYYKFFDSYSRYPQGLWYENNTTSEEWKNNKKYIETSNFYDTFSRTLCIEEPKGDKKN